MTSKKIILYIFMSLLISIVIGFRLLGDDPDFLNYSRFYNNLNYSNGVDDTRFEPGFVFLAYVFKTVTNLDIYWFYYLLATITLFFKLFLFGENRHPIIILFIYLIGIGIIQEMTQVRAAIGMSFALMSVYYKSNKNMFYCYCFFILAVSMHYSMLFFSMVLFCPNGKWFLNRLKTVPLLVLFFCILGLFIIIKPYLIHNVTILSVYAERINDESFNFLSVRFLGLIPPLIIGYFFVNSFNVFYKSCYLLSLLAFVFSVPFSVIPTLVHRFFEMGWVCFYFWVPAIPKKTERYIALSILSLVSIYSAVRNIYLVPMFN